MENFLWQKTLLDMYHSFDRNVIMSDNKFNRLVAKSMYNNNTYLLYSEMVSSMTRKNNCMLAKCIVDNALEKLRKTNNNILDFYYRLKLSFKEIAEKEQINIRQVFRNFDKELAKFAFYLTEQGYDSAAIMKEFGMDSLFLSNYNRLQIKVNNKAKFSIQMAENYVDEDCNHYNQEPKFAKDDFVFLEAVCD